MQRRAAPFTDEAAEDMLTIDPPPFSTMPGRKAWIVQNMLRTLRSKAKAHCSSVAPSTAPWWTKPAQLNSTSTAPVSVAKAPMAALSRTSSLCVRMPSTPFSAKSFSASTSVAQTVAPSLAKARAVAAPIPCPAAVTTQALPRSRMCLSPISHQLGDEYRQREHNANSQWRRTGRHRRQGGDRKPEAFPYRHWRQQVGRQGRAQEGDADQAAGESQRELGPGEARHHDQERRREHEHERHQRLGERQTEGRVA